jgi:WhiB family redox-sensing transcriptional regulator
MTWQEQAACIGADPELFWQEPVKGRPGAAPTDPHAEARAICAVCPVIAQCLKWATDNREYGFLGGMTPAERESARRRAQRGLPPTNHNVTAANDEATRERLYREGLSDPDIGAVVGLHARSVREWRVRRGYPANVTVGVPTSALVHDLRMSLWESELPDRLIAEGSHTTVGTIKAWRRKYGLPANITPQKVTA